MVTFVDEKREEYGVEQMCKVLPIAPSTYFEQKARQADPSRVPPRIRRDRVLREEIQRVWDENHQAYGAHKVWKQLNRESQKVARCTIERLMREMGLRGARRGSGFKVTTVTDSTPRPADLVDRDFTATKPNQLWVADLTYVATWLGFVYVAFVIDAYSRMIVGWHVSSSLGSVGDSYDNALAETIIGLYKTEVIRQRGPWNNLEHVEFETLEWVDWFNSSRLFTTIGDIPPIELGQLYYRTTRNPTRSISTQLTEPPENPGRFNWWENRKQEFVIRGYRENHITRLLAASGFEVAGCHPVGPRFPFGAFAYLLEARRRPDATVEN